MKKAQVAAETLMAVILILGLLLVMTVIGAQQSEEAKKIRETQEKINLCQTVSSTIEQASNLQAQSNLNLFVSQRIWLGQNSINFSPDKNEYYCYFNAEVKDTNNSSLRLLDINYYTVSKNTIGQVVISPGCTPKRCTDPGFSCGTFLDQCGGQISCQAGCICGNAICQQGENSITCPTDCGGGSACNRNGICDPGESYPGCGDCWCGNHTCDSGETYLNCPTDCGSCNNNGVCDPGETTISCPADCKCRNGTCDSGETSLNCPQDCFCGNGTCDSTENKTTCPADCFCGNGTCESGENGLNCPVDCGSCNYNGTCDTEEIPGTCTDCYCGNHTCDSGENSVNCPGDCGLCNSNGTCESGESTTSCPADCYCGNGTLDSGEQCDGTNLGGQTCQGLGYDAGTLSCSLVCTYNTSSCCDQECSPPGALECVDSTSYRVCGNSDLDVCNEWVTYSCAPGETCTNGICTIGCVDECSPYGTTQCVDNQTYQVCSNIDGDACLEWGFTTQCPIGYYCTNGQCYPLDTGE